MSPHDTLFQSFEKAQQADGHYYQIKKTFFYLHITICISNTYRWSVEESVTNIFITIVFIPINFKSTSYGQKRWKSRRCNFTYYFSPFGQKMKLFLPNIIDIGTSSFLSLSSKAFFIVSLMLIAIFLELSGVLHCVPIWTLFFCWKLWGGLKKTIIYWSCKGKVF